MTLSEFKTEKVNEYRLAQLLVSEEGLKDAIDEAYKAGVDAMIPKKKTSTTITLEGEPLTPEHLEEQRNINAHNKTVTWLKNKRIELLN